MYQYIFHFPENPTGENGELKINVFAESEEDAWESISERLDIEKSYLIDYTNPTIQMRQIRAGDLIVSKGTEIVADPDDPWPHIVSSGIRDITSALNSTVGTMQKERYDLEKSYLSIDKSIIMFFLVALLASLGFSFFLIYD